MILVTVGSTFGFDRLVRAADELAALHPDEQFFAQIGNGSYLPVHMEYVRFVARSEFPALLGRAHAVISHAGIGTISETLRCGKPLLVLARRKAFGESANDHQAETAQRFAGLGHVLVADSERQLATMLATLRVFTPTPRAANSGALATRIGTALGFATSTGSD